MVGAVKQNGGLEMPGKWISAAFAVGVAAALGLAAPAEAGPLQAGDIVVLLGEPERLLAAEERLLRG